VQLRARNLSEFFSVEENDASSNKFSSLEGGLYLSSTNQCFQNFQISYVSQILQWIPTKPNDGEAKGSLLGLFQKDFLRIYHWRKVVCLFCLFVTFLAPKSLVMVGWIIVHFCKTSLLCNKHIVSMFSSLCINISLNIYIF
jgi:hypothetical protein